MNNIKYAYQTNMWGLQVPLKKRNNWDEWYKKDINNSIYYMDWETILKYHVANGYFGIELMFHMETYVREYFSSTKEFLEFVKSVGIQAIPAVFAVAIGAENKNSHEDTFLAVKRVVDFAAELESEILTIMPASGYYGNGPLNDEQLQNCVDLMDRVGEYANDKGITPCVHSEFWCAINKDRLEEYLDKVNHKTVGFCIDTAQVSIMGFDPAQLYEKYHEITKYIHLKDTKKIGVSDEERFKAGAEFPNDGDRWFFEPGGGNVDFESLYRSMKKHAYKGWVAMETDGTPDPLATMTLSKYFVDTVLSPIYK